MPLANTIGIDVTAYFVLSMPNKHTVFAHMFSIWGIVLNCAQCMTLL
ncbi:hypothetical protein GMES_4076 [Paraglaciecola mesophila KMM 241]|uniref:Uncharacterized protein n=1 Tax=Paraglaciecola mesophila KMM 241 TaxID=1128912 RepID=K6Y0K3_9ALTE|nr:hypothetical protein GMES_4076 [Paraglaciecola mesophila KMM 241]